MNLHLKGGVKRYENSSATLPQINALLPPLPLSFSLTHTHDFLSAQLKLSEVEVYVEHLGEVKCDRSFPPLHKDLCPVKSSHQIPQLQWTHSSGTFSCSCTNTCRFAQTNSLFHHYKRNAGYWPWGGWWRGRDNVEPGVTLSSLNWSSPVSPDVRHHCFSFFAHDFDVEIISVISEKEMRKWRQSIAEAQRGTNNPILGSMNVVCKCLFMKSKSWDGVTFSSGQLCVCARTDARAHTQMAFCTAVQPSAQMCQSPDRGAERLECTAALKWVCVRTWAVP